MVSCIQKFVERYRNLASDEQIDEQAAMAEFLFQVNHIEGEGFSTLEKTVQAISNGALELDSSQLAHEDDRLKAVHCLHQATRHWFKPRFDLAPEEVPQLDESRLLQSHQFLLGPVWPRIAGRFRNQSEHVYVERQDGSQHSFLSPERVRPALSSLFARANRELRKIFCLQSEPERIEALLNFAGRFFFDYECIHPFVDGNGRTGRIMLAYLLQSVTFVFPNVLFVDGRGHPPFVDEHDYTKCFERAHKSVDEVPRDLAALVIEGVYVGWKRLFRAIDSSKNCAAAAPLRGCSKRPRSEPAVRETGAPKKFKYS